MGIYDKEDMRKRFEKIEGKLLDNPIKMVKAVEVAKKIFECTVPTVDFLTHCKKDMDRETFNFTIRLVLNSILVTVSDNFDEALGYVELLRNKLIAEDKEINKL